MTRLRVSPDLELPAELQTHSTVVYGMRGAGKTSGAVVIVEELFVKQQQLVVIDPTGVWWGLRASARGNATGLPILVIGGQHPTGGIALDPTAGAFVADLVVDEGLSVVLDVSTFASHADQVRFVTAFLERLYRRKTEHRSGLLVVMDEADEFAPQPGGGTALGPDYTACIAAVKRVVLRGRAFGLGVLLIAQRAQHLNRGVAEMADVLIVFRMAGPRSLDAAKEWLAANAPAKELAEIMVAVPTLADGEAFVSSPGWLRLMKRIRFRTRDTYDAGATPEVGHQRVEPKKLAEPDLARIRERMAATIERAKAEDPKALRARVRELELQLKKPAAVPPPIRMAPPQRIKVAILKDGQLARAEKILERIERIQQNLMRPFDGELAALAKVGGDVAEAIRQVRADAPPARAGTARATDAPPIAPPVREAPRGRPVRARDDAPPAAAGARTAEGITSRQQRFLDAAATLETLSVEVTRETVAGWLGVHPRGGSVGEELKALVDAGLITYERGRIVVTDVGRAAAGEIPADQAIARARDALSGRQQRILDIVVGVYPGAIARDAIAEQMGIHPRGGSFGEDLARLRSRGLIDYDRGEVRARDFLFAGSR